MSLLGSVVSGLGDVVSSLTGGTSTTSASGSSSSAPTTSTTSTSTTSTSTSESTTTASPTTPTPTSTASTSSTTPTPTTTATPSTGTAIPTTTTSTPSTTSRSSDSPTSSSTTASTIATPSSTTAAATTTTASSSSGTSMNTDSDSRPSASAASGSLLSTTTAATSARTASSSATTSISATASSTDETSTARSRSGSTSTFLRGQSESDSSASIYSDNSSGYGSLATGGAQDSSQSLSTGPIVGIVVGALAVVLLAVLLVMWRLRRKRPTRHSSMPTPTLDFCYTASPVNFVIKPGVSERFDTSSTGLFTSYRKAKLNAAQAPDMSVQESSRDWADDAITALRIPFEKLARSTLINRGGYGEVYLGSYHGERVAVKTLLQDKHTDLDEINAFLAEIRMMASIKHERIVRFIGAAWDQLTDLCAVSEFMEGGDLRSLLKHFEETEKRRHGFDADKARIALHVAQALTYLHSLDPQVLHRDLKSRNILLTADLQAKLTDFGVSRKYTFSSMTACVGTQLWMAPEVMMGDRYDASADIFSFGVVLSELDTQQAPYAESKLSISGRKVPAAALLQLVSSGLVRVEFSPKAPQALVELGHACVALDPAARPSASEVLYQLQLIHQLYERYTI